MNAATIVLIILGVMILGLAILFLESARELKQARVKEYTMQLPGHPRGRILFLSDYHEAVRGKNNEMILAKIREIKPDIILIGGDMVNGKSEKEDFTPAITLINGMVEIAPVVYAMGNHEMRCVVNSREYGYHWDQYEQALSPKIRMLINDHMDWELPEGKIRIYGLNMEKCEVDKYMVVYTIVWTGKHPSDFSDNDIAKVKESFIKRIKDGDNSSNLQKMLENSKENGYDIMIKYQNENYDELFSFSILPYEV